MSTTTEDSWRRVVPEGGVPSYQVFTKDIQKSEQDERVYRLIKLDNGIKAMLIHDDKADKAAAALDVGVGHLADPVDMPGTAHFCEHLLFMGTEQFPKENEYSEYLAKNNGGSNAYTSTSNTNYYFQVATTALDGALQRFSGFFHSPLFAPSCTSRELNAVDSEHKKNHQQDLWRVFQLSKHLSIPGHVWSKFGSGSRESLTRAAKNLYASTKPSENGKSLQPSPIPSRIASPAPSISSATSESDADGGAVGRETRRRLVEWWTKEYCASRMALCITGKESLDDLANMASKYFSPIANRGNLPLPVVEQHPFGEKEKGTLVSVASIMSFHALELVFPLESQLHHWRTKPAHFLAHLIGHEGPGSLHSYLKSKNWVVALSCGPQSLARGIAVFKVSVQLTEEGFKNYRDVILACTNYISLLRDSQFKDYTQHERVLLSQMRFRFAEKKAPDSYTSAMAEHLHHPVPEDLMISAFNLTWDWDENGDDERRIREYLDSFRLSEGRVILMAKQEEIEKLTPGIEWSKEPWYGTLHNVTSLEPDFIEKANGPNVLPELKVPGPNEFIPTDLDVEKRDVSEPLKRPYLIRETPLSTLWHKKDDRFWIPKAKIVIDIRSPVVNETARSAVLTRLYTDLVNDALTEFSYDADLAGLSYHLFAHSNGIYVTVNGYNDKVSVLLKHVFENFKKVSIDPGRFYAITEEIKREWRNFYFGQSYSLSDYYTRYLLTERQWTIEDKLRELITVKSDEVHDHIRRFLEQVNMRILVAGNIHKSEAIEIAEMLEDGLQPCGPDAVMENSLKLPNGSDVIWSAPIINPNQANSAITYFVNFGQVADQRLRVVSALLSKILTEPAFNVLRTKEQLGYIVFCTGLTLAGSSEKGLRIVVQSEKFPSYLEERIEAFLDTMKEKLSTMTADEFAEHRKSLEKKWLEVDKNLNDEVSRYVAQVNSNHLDFLRDENDAAVLREVTKEEVLDLFMSKVHQSSTTRAKLSVHMLSQKPRAKKISAEASQRFIAQMLEKFPDVDVDSWKDSLEETPGQAEFATHWAGVLGDSEEAKALLATIPTLADEYPIPGEKQLEEKPGATYVKDIPTFKAGLEVSHPTGPLVQWNDLPTPKL